MACLTFPNLTAIQTRSERLPAGLQSYYRTLDVMTDLVQKAVLDYELKIFVNSLLLAQKIPGHDFSSEVMSLFFSLALQSATRVILLMLSLCRMLSARFWQAAVIVMTRSRSWRRCWRWRAIRRVLCAVVKRRTCLTMFGAKSIWIGATNGCPLIRPMRKPIQAGHSLLLIA